MPLTKKGKKIEKAMEREYGEKKGEGVFYASKNAGKITGVERKKPGRIDYSRDGQHQKTAKV